VPAKDVTWLRQSKFIQKIKELSFVEKVILFGSRARGNNAELSDIDLAIFCPTATIQEWFIVLDLIEHAETLLPIDCIRFDKVDLDLQNKIKKDGVEL
jgi:uncharacterized protein